MLIAEQICSAISIIDRTIDPAAPSIAGTFPGIQNAPTFLV